MGITCNNVCHKYRAKKPNKIGRYLSGQKRCNSCDVFINWDGLWCPCCNYKLRLTPRSSKYKKKYVDAMSEQRGMSVNGL